jgi:fructose/tagatose bisphosphate aldolase
LRRGPLTHNTEPGNVKLQPQLLKKHQAYVKEKIGATEDKPVFLVFHGGSGSSVEDFREAISYGVVKSVFPSLTVHPTNHPRY